MSSTVVTTGETTALIINTIIGLTIVAVFGYLVYTQLPRIEKILKEKLEESLTRNSKNKGNQPLQKIFLGYSHKSVKDWIQWITNQELDKKMEAFKNLEECLQVDPDELGAVTSDIVFAVANFGFDESTDVLQNFAKTIREKYLQINSLEIYYKAATQSLSKLNPEKASEFLQSEFMALKGKKDYELLQRDILAAFENVPISPELENFWVNVLTLKAINQRVKEEILTIIQSYEPATQNDILTRAMAYYVDNENVEINKEDKRVIELFFGISSKFLKDGVDDVWQLSIRAIQQERTKDLFIELLSSVITNKDFKLSEEQIAAIVDDPHAGSIFRDLLSARYSLSDDEKALMKKDFDIAYYQELRHHGIKFFRPTTTKTINKNFLNDYHEIADKYASDGAYKKTADGTGLMIINGTGELEKLYLCDIIAANLNKAFVYINAKAILGSIADISKLKPNLEHHKPCIVYLDYLYEAMTETLDRTSDTNFKNLAKAISDLYESSSMKFFANVRVSKEATEQNAKITEALQESFGGKHIFIKELNLPDENERAAVIANFSEKLSQTRSMTPELADKLSSSNAGNSKLDFIDYLSRYFEKTLLLYGELRQPSELQLSDPS